MGAHGARLVTLCNRHRIPVTICGEGGWIHSPCLSETALPPSCLGELLRVPRTLSSRVNAGQTHFVPHWSMSSLFWGGGEWAVASTECAVVVPGPFAKEGHKRLVMSH